MQEFKLTQSAIKDLEDKSTCPKRWRAQWIEKTISSDSTDAMNNGKYFEYLCLGGSAHDDGVVDLPKNKDKSKSVAQVRIERQAELFKRRFDPSCDDFMGFEIVDRQIKIEFEDHEGTIDFKCVDAKGEESIWDLKYCKDINGYAEYNWSRPEQMDLLQQVYYEWLYYKKYGKRLKSHLYIADISPEEKTSVLDLRISDGKRENMITRVNAAWETIEFYEKNGWPTTPSFSKCQACKLSSICQDKNFKPEIITVEY